MLSFQSHFSIVKDNWQLISSDLDSFSDSFYQNLFQLDPALRQLFKRALKMQQRKMMSVLSDAIDNIDNPSKLIAPLMGVGFRHGDYSVEPAHFESFKKAFIMTLQQHLGSSFDERSRQAWSVSIEFIEEMMKAAIRHAAANQSSLPVEYA